MKKEKRKTFVEALIGMIILSVIIIAVSSYFIFNTLLIGPIFLVLGFISLIFLQFFKIKIGEIYPDMVFGIIDNGVLVFAAILGGQVAGVLGAIIGGVAGNTITDGIGGLFEGHIAEKQRSKFEARRTALSSSLGKMSGCLFGAGIGLIILWLIGLL